MTLDLRNVDNATRDRILEIVAERDAALARVRELEEKGRDWYGYDARIAALSEALRDVLETACSCHCEAAYTDRELHAPECHYDEVTSARRVLNGDKNCD